mgnify:CR=1 FL=1
MDFCAKLEKHEITTDDFDGTRDVKIVYANLIDGKVDEKYDGLNLSLSYYQRLDKTTVDDMLDMYASRLISALMIMFGLIIGDLTLAMASVAVLLRLWVRINV